MTSMCLIVFFVVYYALPFAADAGRIRLVFDLLILFVVRSLLKNGIRSVVTGHAFVLFRFVFIAVIHA